MSQYVATEIESVTAWTDQNGNLYLNREDAVEANFNSDLESLVEKILYDEGGSWQDGEYVIPVLKNIAKNNPDYLRILVGDRSAT